MKRITNLNLLFKADNLDVLKALKSTHSNSIKCVYLDPPYNTGVNQKHFRDDIKSSEWIRMMQKRLHILKDLMREDGSIWISIDDSELYNLKNLCDKVFKKENFLATITWQHKMDWEGYKGKFQLDHTYIICYRKTEKFEFNNNHKPPTVWLESNVGGHGDAIKESNELFGEENAFSTPKPERLMRYIIDLATKKDEIVLDCFSGSGTTGSAAQKMGRRWIMIEVGDQCETHILPRMEKIVTQSDRTLLLSNEHKLFSNYFFYFPEVKSYQSLKFS